MKRTYTSIDGPSFFYEGPSIEVYMLVTSGRRKSSLITEHIALHDKLLLSLLLLMLRHLIGLSQQLLLGHLNFRVL